MTDDFLKRDIEAHRHNRKKRRILLVVGMGICLLLTYIVGVSLWSDSHTTPRQQHVALASNAGHQSLPPTNTTNTEPSNVSSPVQNATGNTQTQQSPVNVPLPQPTGAVDSATFIADAHTVATTYQQITDLVTFSPTETDDTKADDITQAMGLQQQTSLQMSSLRSLLVNAGVTSGQYMDLTQQEESGVSKVATGLVFMNYWVTNRTDTSDFNIGLNEVDAGAGILLQFSSGVAKL